MCHTCDEKDHIIYERDKKIRRLERKMTFKAGLPVILGIFAIIGSVWGLTVFSFKTYYSYENTVVLAKETQLMAARNKNEIMVLKYETAKELALINQNMNRVLKILEDKPAR
jgi:hypothetical protein